LLTTARHFVSDIAVFELKRDVKLQLTARHCFAVMPRAMVVSSVTSV